ncbi:MAG: outer membrane protein OmpA-like peptidoglycan-associated protein [Myxococcota bacterium]|jgi:outer membrane protein OmpA-like peptidoglycan-associated protein
MVRTLTHLSVSLFILSGCVSKQRFSTLETNYADLQVQNTMLQNRNAGLETTLYALELSDPVTAGYYRDLMEKLAPMMESGEVQVYLHGDRMLISFTDQIRFDLADDTMDSDSRKVARELAGHIRDIPGVSFQIEGHTDRVPVSDDAEWDSNWELGAERALSVLDVLVANGVPADRLSLASYGETEPLVDVDGPEPRNRRVSVTLQPDLADVDGAAGFAAAASEHDALEARDSRVTLRAARRHDHTVVAETDSTMVRPVTPQMHHDFAIPVVNGDTLRIWTEPGRLNFRYGENLMIIKVADQAEIRGELDRLQREVDDRGVFADVHGDEIDDEIRALLIEAIDRDTIIWIDGVAIPGNEVDDEIGQYWEEVFDAPESMYLSYEEIDDEIEELRNEVEEELEERAN